MVKLGKKEQQKYRNAGYDLEFIQRVQPQGGMKFNERYIAQGDCYVACLHVYSLAEDIAPLWLTSLMNNKDTLASFDVATANKEEVIKDINRSIAELRDRTETERRATDRDDANWELENLKGFARSITQQGEIVKLVKLRIFIYDPVLEQLEKRIGDLKKEIAGQNYKGQVYIFKQKEEWQSLFASYDQQIEYLGTSAGRPLPSENIGFGIPFHHQALKDPRGIYLGQTSTGGAFILDPFFSTDTRTSFSGFVFGKMGAGKSTLLKQLLEGLLAKDCFIRGFDKAKDYYTIVQQQGGKIIDLSGSKSNGIVETGMINPLEVFATIIIEDTGEVDEKGSFLQHLSKLTNMLRFLSVDISETAVKEFRNYLLEFYIDYGLHPKRGSNEPLKITGLPPEEYPIMEEFMAYLDKVELEKGATAQRLRDLETLRVQVRDMVIAYGDIFNGHTTLENFEDEKIVFFDIDGISKIDKPVFNCQLFTALTLIWSHALKNGRRMKYLREEKNYSFENLTYFMVFLDECHNVINSENKFANKYVLEFEREMRKFFAGIFFATQSPQEMLPPPGSNVDVSDMKAIFELTQYKIFLNMDNSVLETLKSVLGESLTESEFRILPELKRGEAIVQVSSTETYNVMFDPDEKQLERFRGGQ
ncbi:ATP-binding protein [Bacillus cytotoxicus]|uniref:VirB4 family type IV secretion system protein n=1 Tax=Bacillus cereus group TaxID=86661 RepID=UPI000B976BEA|nr:MULTISPECIES: ATP-binding protein [Bacillus cereus group]AWC30976.1 ATP-binding protein [Bacillus cytotoxicus]AWC35073.1 ATP-binding protein [Bacillus cytotoxicus]AWC39039.1 ATP-binding protein [Bacillus cytotoxicus]AWC43068.1 ATP-binding protein [Bacillus cytotoxicus]AWC47019.1 ATP-binding protein [Bacillus cytotoxicus]